jgi:hypothetical protein
MISRDNNGKVVGEINTSRTTDGRTITTNTVYQNGQAVTQNIAVRDSQGRVETTNVYGHKILP